MNPVKRAITVIPSRHQSGRSVEQANDFFYAPHMIRDPRVHSLVSRPASYDVDSPDTAMSRVADFG